MSGKTYQGYVADAKSSPGLTPSQTVGPFFASGLVSNGAYDWADAFSSDLVTPDAVGERIRISGTVYDGDGAVVPDSMLEVWQADGQGRYAGPREGTPTANAAFRGFGRCGTTAQGVFTFDTVKPGPVPGLDGAMQAPHILMAVFARGMLLQVYTRIYFSDEKANATDAILSQVPAERRETLIAKRSDGEGGVPLYQFDIHLQGNNETVFFLL